MQLNQRGVTLQTVILAGVLTLAATGLGIVIYNLIADRSGDIENAAVDTDFLEPIGFEPRPLDPGPGGGGFAPLPDLGISPRPAGDEEAEEKDSEAEEEEDIFDGLKYSHTFNAGWSGFQSPFNCAVHTDGTISCWGRGGFGQLGDGNFYTTGSNKPVKVQGINDAVAVSLGYTHACALHQDRTISCWGEGFPNVLGTTYKHNFNKPLKILDPNGNPRTGFAQVAAGNRFTCARYIDSHPKAGRITCWGNDRNGTLGTKKDDKGYRGRIPDYSGVESNPDILSPTTPDEIFDEVFGVDDAVDLSAGYDHACVLHQDKSASCWGYWDHGALGGDRGYIIDDRGVGRTITSSSYAANYPIKVIDSNGGIIRDFDKVVASNRNTCGLRGGEGSLWCWGVLPRFPSVPFATAQFINLVTATPVKVSDFEGLERLARVKDFALGNSLCAVLTSDDSVWCFGTTSFLSDISPSPTVIGRLAGGITIPPSEISPTHVDVYYYKNLREISHIQSPLDMASGSSDSNCFLLADKTVSCEGGNNLFGQLAEGHRIEDVMALGT